MEYIHTIVGRKHFYSNNAREMDDPRAWKMPYEFTMRAE